MSTCATAPAASQWANQALPDGPARRTSATTAASMTVAGSPLLRVRYRQVGHFGHTAGRSVQRSATDFCDDRPPALSNDGHRGATPASSRRRLRTWPKLRLGSNLCISAKTSPRASLVGSHQPLPSWLTMRISPLPRRYLRLRFVLSLRSSRHGGGVRS